MLDLKDQDQLEQEGILRFVAATDRATYFGPKSVVAGLIQASAAHAASGEAHVEEGFRRLLVPAAQGSYLRDRAIELGVTPKGPQRAFTYLVVVPKIARVSAISGSGPYTLTVSGFAFQAGDAIRIKCSGEATTTVSSAPTSSTITVSLSSGLAGQIDDDLTAGNDVIILVRVTLPADTEVIFQGGTRFHTLDTVTTGDANAIFAGEGTDLSLVDKVLCEAVQPGAAGNVGCNTATGLATSVRGVDRVFNPLPATGGADTQDDYALKYELAHSATALAQSPLRALEAIAKQLNTRVLRVSQKSTSALSTVSIGVLTLSRGTLSSDEKTDLATGIASRIAWGVRVKVSDIPLVAVEVSASVTLTFVGSAETATSKRKRLLAAWVNAAEKITAYLDLRTWPFGQTVDASTLLSIVRNATGIASLVTSSFQPETDVAVTAGALPYFASLTLTDATSGISIGDEISQVYP